MGMAGYEVRQIQRKDCTDLVLNVHYAKRWPSITYAFGLFYEGSLVGAVTYGTPASATLRNGLAGKENADKVLELNRLVLRSNLKNEATFLVGRSLARGTGRTTQQMLAAPVGAIYVWVNGVLDYPRNLARKHGREDLKIVAPSWLEDPFHCRGLRVSAVVVDHAADLTRSQSLGLQELQWQPWSFEDVNFAKSAGGWFDGQLPYVFESAAARRAAFDEEGE